MNGLVHKILKAVQYTQYNYFVNPINGWWNITAQGVMSNFVHQTPVNL